MKHILIYMLVGLGLLPSLTQAQEIASKDTVIVNFGDKSSIVFYVNDKNDLKSLEQYDLNAIARDLTEKLKQTDSGSIEAESEEEFLVDSTQQVTTHENQVTDDSTDEENVLDSRKIVKRHETRQHFNIDIGLNNYLENGKFPSDNNADYSLRPWGSWYIAFGPTYKTHLAGNLFVEYGINASWYNFKFEQNDIRLEKNGIETRFVPEGLDLDYAKSKLTVAHLNASVVPVIDFGKKLAKKERFWDDWDDDDDHYRRGFRIGVGGYAGYKIASYAKYVVEIDGDRKKNKDKDSFYLENWRYGARVQVGFRGTDIFVNYDLNELFVPGKGPSLNAFSFGITF